MAEYADYDCFDLDKYSTFAKWFKKYYLTNKDKFCDEYIHGLVRYLEGKDRPDVFVFKLNAFWDASSAIQEILLKDAEHLAKVFVGCIASAMVENQW